MLAPTDGDENWGDRQTFRTGEMEGWDGDCSVTTMVSLYIYSYVRPVDGTCRSVRPRGGELHQVQWRWEVHCGRQFLDDDGSLSVWDSYPKARGSSALSVT